MTFEITMSSPLRVYNLLLESLYNIADNLDGVELPSVWSLYSMVAFKEAVKAKIGIEGILDYDARGAPVYSMNDELSADSNTKIVDLAVKCCSILEGKFGVLEANAAKFIQKAWRIHSVMKKASRDVT